MKKNCVSSWLFTRCLNMLAISTQKGRIKIP